jgi:hypothetical protein
MDPSIHQLSMPGNWCPYDTSVICKICDGVNIPATAPTLLAGQPHSTEHGSVKAELVARAQHTHTLFRDGNANIYYRLEEATRIAAFAASIKPFQRTKDGRGTFQALSQLY